METNAECDECGVLNSERVCRILFRIRHSEFHIRRIPHSEFTIPNLRNSAFAIPKSALIKRRHFR